MKSFQYSYMPEEGMYEESELVIHQASHTRYFEDFLKFIDYNKLMPEIMKTQVMDMVREHVSETFEAESVELEQFELDMKLWATSEKRELQERLDKYQVIEVAAHIVEHTPDAELKMKLGETEVKFR